MKAFVRCAALVGCLATLSVPAKAQAQAPEHTEAMRNAARVLGEEGIAAFEAGDYEAALVKFDRAETLVGAPTLGLRAARSLVRLGRWVDATRRFERTERMPIDPTLSDANRATQETARREAAAERTQLEARLPTYVVDVQGAAPDAVLVDGEAMPIDSLGRARPIDPGAHVVRATRRGVSTEARFEAVEGRRAEVMLRWPPARDEPPLTPRAGAPRAAAEDERSAHEVAGWIVGSAGVLAVGAGVATYFVGAGLRDDLDAQRCDDETCRASVAGADAEDDVATYNAVGTASAVMLVAGSVLTAGGVVLLLTAPSGSSAPASARATVVAGPDARGGAAGFAGLRGSF